MVSFLVNQSRETPESRLEVETQTPEDKTGASDLRPGVHRFRLVVENERGVQSEPAIVEVEVIEPTISPDLIRQDRFGRPEGRLTKGSGKGKAKDKTKSGKKPKATKTTPKR